MSKVKSQNKVFLMAFDFVYQVGLLIILPLVIFALLGKLVDERTRTSPLFFFIGLLVGLIIAGLLVWKKVNEIIRQIER
ncbi:MAG: hypothetical protein UT11_C0026G0003 [Berkelbacteria bacterium GW2011_GWA2_38_9]|uniref:AtpZ/AtpI family protein n=1 Tax=Berkelbacteria bacterium GW2011_GWA2_38_9 TaxID=1618334 RepID=A0A0G0PJA5_9BACT|nr:MAG: hypothetical protein UT11_C0026G0003 [Berkelbacteria bacterium GW2011_GWA2_38_9]